MFMDTTGLIIALRELDSDDTENTADDELSLRDAEEMLDSEIRDAVTTEHDDREWNRMPSGYQQLQPPAHRRADQRAEPEFCGISNRQARAAAAFVQTPPA